MKFTNLFFILIIFLLKSNCINASSLYQLGIKDICNYSSNIIEGKVTSQSSYYNKSRTFIYTKYTIDVKSTIKGKEFKTLDFICDGGIIGNVQISSSAEPQITKNDEGFFFLSVNKYGKYVLSTGSQSYFRYDYLTQIISNSFLHYSINSNEFFDSLEKILNLNIERTYPRLEKEQSIQSNPYISKLSPLTLSAGTESVLTITGSGFGSINTGIVYFANSDDGGVTYIQTLASLILSWTDSKILIKVPFHAGTGKVLVKQGILTSISQQQITIDYARANAESGVENFKVSLVNQSGVGGYLINLNQNFESNINAKNSYEKALSNWRCNSLANYTVSANTEIDSAARDNINIVRFAKAGELKPGALGITYSYYESCNSGYWYLKEFDMSFLDTSFWNLDSLPSNKNQFDFNSVVLHELGHAHQLAHVINPTSIMHFSINMGNDKRIIDTNSLRCITTILDGESKQTICGPSAMKTLNSSICDDVFFTYYEFVKPKLYPNPTSNELNLEFFLPEKSLGAIQIFNSLGKLIAEPISGSLFQGKNNIQVQIEDYHFINGLYFLKLNALNKTFVNKFIISN